VSGVWRKELAFGRLCAGFQGQYVAGWVAQVRPEVCTGITRVRLFVGRQPLVGEAQASSADQWHPCVVGAAGDK
jgi:hypothetical protein